MPANLTIYVNNYDSQVGSSLSVKWEAPLDTGGGEIKKYNILVQAKSKEFPDEKARMLNLTVLHEDAKGRFFTINSLLPYSSISVRLREGGGDKPIWGPYAGPKVVQMSQGGNLRAFLEELIFGSTWACSYFLIVVNNGSIFLNMN